MSPNESAEAIRQRERAPKLSQLEPILELRIPLGERSSTAGCNGKWDIVDGATDRLALGRVKGKEVRCVEPRIDVKFEVA